MNKVANQPSSEGSDKPDRIQITVPKQYKVVDDGVWEDLETYLYKGFLTSPAHILGKTFVFKTLNHTELSNMAYLRPIKSSPSEVKDQYRAAFISHSIFIADGENVLYERPKHMRRLMRIFSKLESSSASKIVENLALLNEKVSRLHPLTEVYVHENRSKYKWLQVKGLPIHSDLVTGIPGTSGLGMNYCQQTWVALNRLIETREQLDADWSNAKFVGSCFNGKGVRSVDEKDRARKEKERTEREDLKLKVLYRYLNRKAGSNEEPPVTVKLPDGREAVIDKRHRMETVEELAKQLSAALSGEKDHHDIVVENRMKKLSQLQSSMEEDRLRMYRGNELKQDLAPSSSVPMHGASRVLGGKKEVDEQLARMKRVRDKHLQDWNNRQQYSQTDLENSDETDLEGS